MDARGSTVFQGLAPLIGRWRTNGILVDSGKSFTATDVYEWFPGNHFILHHVDADMDGEHVQALEVFGLDGDRSGIFARSYESGGMIVDSRVVMDGRELQVISTTERFRGTFEADFHAIAGLWERSDDGKAWTPWMRVRLEKVKQDQ